MAGEPLILVVEDEPAQREVLAYNIRAEGFDVVTAAAGDEALAAVRETPPDVIVLDWMLPHVSGIEVCPATENGLCHGENSDHHALGPH